MAFRSYLEMNRLRPLFSPIRKISERLYFNQMRVGLKNNAFHGINNLQKNIISINRRISDT